MSAFMRRWGAEAANFTQWTAHLFAFAPEPPLHATWTCRRCRRRHPTSRKQCGCQR